MDRTGLLADVFDAVGNIALGRKNLATDGLEHAGRLFYEKGISVALSAFQKAQADADLETIILVELYFLQQEFHFCSDADTIARSSLTQAIDSFENALRCLKIVEDAALYRAVDTAFPVGAKYRKGGFPKDAVHHASAAHWTRIQNSLRTPGINMAEKAVLRQRAANMKTIQCKYMEKQKKALND